MSLLDVKHSGPSVGHLDSRYVNVTGDTMTGDLILFDNTVHLKDYTLTIPATGTAALLATANVFTAIQKINVNSTAALLVEQDGVKDNALLVDTTNGRVGINVVPERSLHIVGDVMRFDRDGNSPGIITRRTTIGIANGDTIQAFNAEAYNSAGTIKTYTQFTSAAVNKTDGAEYGSFLYRTIVKGTLTSVMSISNNLGLGTTSPSGRLHIVGSADIIQIRVQAHSTQTANLQTWENSSGVVATYIKGNGAIGQQTAITQPTTQDEGAYFNTDLYVNGAMGQNVNAVRVLAQFRGGANIGGALAGIRGTAYNFSANSIANVFGMTFRVGVTNASATITTAYGADVGLNNLTGGTITNFRGFNLSSPSGAGSPTITNAYGIYLENVNYGATLNYAIYTNAGLVHFGDTVDLASGKNLTLLAGNITTDTTTGTKIGTATTQKLGFWNVTPVVQQVTNAYTSDGEGSAYTGIDNAQAGTVYATVADLNQLRVAYETLRASYDDLLTKLKTTGIVA